MCQLADALNDNQPFGVSLAKSAGISLMQLVSQQPILRLLMHPERRDSQLDSAYGAHCYRHLHAKTHMEVQKAHSIEHKPKQLSPLILEISACS